MFIGKQDRHRKHHPAPCQTPTLPFPFDKHNPHGIRTIGTALHVPKQHTTSQSKDFAAVDPIQSQGRDRIATGSADLK